MRSGTRRAPSRRRVAASVVIAAALVAAVLGTASRATVAPSPPSAAPPPSSSPAPPPAALPSASPIAGLRTTTTTAVYAVRGGRPLEADVCEPVAAARAPVLVLIHGGAMVTGTRGALQDLCEAGAARGFVAMTVDYRLLPTRYPAQVRDVAAAIDWIRAPAQQRRFGADPDRVRLVGASAGGTIAASIVTGVGLPAGRPASVDRAVLLSGVYDLRPAAVPTRIRADFAAYARCASKACPTAAVVSPQAHLRGTTASLLVMSGDEHELVPERLARRFTASARRAGVDARLLAVPFPDHAAAVVRHRPAAARAMWAFLAG